VRNSNSGATGWILRTRRLPRGRKYKKNNANASLTAEDMYEAVVNTVPQAKFGRAFNESSGPCLTRAESHCQTTSEAIDLNLWSKAVCISACVRNYLRHLRGNSERRYGS
jgi:hypothetical protein